MPRRRSRPRLPLGLLPLLALLLLALQRLTPVLFPARQHGLQLIMPVPRHLAAAQEAELRRLYADDSLFLPPGVPLVPTMPADLDRRQAWHSYTLIGNARHDAAMLRAAAARISRNQAYAVREPGVRIVLGPGTRYAQVVAVLDLMQRLHVPKYALDLERPEPALYVFGRRGAW